MRADAVATGHYARIETDAQGLRHLLRGVDPTKDQGYFLFGLTQAQLACAQFPVGALRKSDVRRMAESRGLPVADKPDSQEICFVPDGDYAAVVERRLPGRPGGLTIDLEGRVLGRHEGVHRFTIGQRKGLGLATGVPLFVVALDALRHVVTVGPRTALERRELTASGVNWIAGVPPAAGTAIAAQIRHRHPAAPASVTVVAADRAHVLFDEAQIAITPGQAVVFYQGDEVLGGGWIE
jgi:tRNA-specific 2-thiouridylase